MDQMIFFEQGLCTIFAPTHIYTPTWMGNRCVLGKYRVVRDVADKLVARFVNHAEDLVPKLLVGGNEPGRRIQAVLGLSRCGACGVCVCVWLGGGVGAGW